MKLSPPPYPLRIKPSQHRQEISHVSLSSELHHLSGVVEEFGPSFRSHVEQVLGENQVSDEVEIHQEEELAHVDTDPIISSRHYNKKMALISTRL